MRTSRRQFAACLGASALAGVSKLSLAQDKNLRVLVGFAAGGAADTVARAVGEGLRDAGYTVVIDNKPGASGRLATEMLIGAPADGTTLLMTPLGNLTLYPHVFKSLRYDPLAQLAGVASVCNMSFALAVGAGSSAATLQDFIAQARKDPAKAGYGTPGMGTAMHVIGELLGQHAKVPLTHIPYKGGSASVTDAIGGAIPAVITTLPNLLPMHRQGKLRILAVSDPEPSPALPGVPTFKSAGFADLVVTETFAFFARSGTPAPVIAQLNQAINSAVESPRVAGVLQKVEYQLKTMSPDALDRQVRAQHARWAAVVKASGYKPEE